MAGAAFMHEIGGGGGVEACDWRQKRIEGH